MALIACHECNHQVSSEAQACPSCGARPRPPERAKDPGHPIALGVCVLFGGAFLWWIFSTLPSAPAKSPAETAADAQKQRDFQSVVAVLRYIKGEMKNPKSFALVSAKMLPGQTVCVEYRGTNSFNAVVTSRYVMSNTVSSASAEAWSSHCAGRAGTDFSAARHAM